MNLDGTIESDPGAQLPIIGNSFTGASNRNIEVSFDSLGYVGGGYLTVKNALTGAVLSRIYSADGAYLPNVDPTISPDGTKIAFCSVSTTATNNATETNGQPWKLEVINVDGTGRRTIGSFRYWNFFWYDGRVEFSRPQNLHWCSDGSAVIHLVDKSFQANHVGNEIVKTTLAGETTLLTNNSIWDYLSGSHRGQSPVGPLVSSLGLIDEDGNVLAFWPGPSPGFCVDDSQL